MFVDLSVRLDNATPAYPGDPRILIKESAAIERDGYLGHEVSLGTHTGTHIDAPAHMLEGHKTLDAFTADSFVGRGKCLDVTHGFDMEKIKAAGIEAHDIVLFHTGMSERYYEPEYFTDYPVMPVEIAEYLVEKSVKMVGLDTCSADNTDGFPVHTTLLARDTLIIETLTNLGSLVGKDFTLYALPLALELDGAPARVIAEIHS